MAGTLPLALTQVLDINGSPLAGASLFFYQVGTVATPQNAFSDFGLTQALPNPVQTDQYGRLPMFYLADGQIHIRLVDPSGNVIFDYPTMQVIGPSSGGGGGGGGSVDPTAVASTGDTKWRYTTETLTGWVKLNGQTIGSATSGASQRANADTQNLFIYLWNNVADTYAPVIGGRGANALADWNANKQITLPDFRGRSPFGLDDMGNTVAGRLTTVSTTTPTTPASVGGADSVVLTEAQLAAHNHGGLTGPETNAHTHPQVGTAQLGNIIGGGSPYLSAANFNETTGNPNQTHGHPIGSDGGNAPHLNMPPFVLVTWYTKL